MANPALARFRASFRLELRHLARTWGYLALHIVLAAVIGVLFYQRDDRSAQALLETTLGRFGISLAALAGMFLAGLSATRSRRARWAPLEDSYPFDWEVWLARWLACAAAAFAFLVWPAALAAVQGPWLALGKGLPVYLLEGLVSVALITALTWLVSSLLRPARWIYPLLAGFWLAAMAGPLYLVRQNPAWNVVNFMRTGASFFTDAWGRMVYGPFPLWQNLFYLGLVIALLAGLALLYRSRRLGRFSRLAGAAAALGVLLAGYNGAAYVRAAQLPEPPALISFDQVEHGNPTNLEQAALVVDLADPQATEITSELTLANGSDQPIQTLDLALDPAFSIVEASLPYERQGAALILRPESPLGPGERLTVSLRYRGRLWRYGDWEVHPTAEDFIDARGIRLTPRAAWYPFPPKMEAPSLSFSIEFRNTGDLVLASNLPPTGPASFAAKNTSWVFIIGSPTLRVVEDDGLRLVVDENDLARVYPFRTLYNEPLRALARFFPDVSLEGLTLLSLGEEGGLPEGTPPVDGRAVVIISRYGLVSMADPDAYRFYWVGYALVRDLWQMGGGQPEQGDNAILTIISHVLWQVIEKDGDVQAVAASFADDEHPVIRTLVQVYQDQGEAGLVRVLQALRARSAELFSLSPEALEPFLREVAQ